MAEKYNKLTWENNKTKLNADNMNRIEDGIEAANETANTCFEDIEKIKNETTLHYVSTNKTITLSLGVGKSCSAVIDGFEDENNIDNGTGTNAVQMKQDVTTIDYTGRNPNATELDSTITGTIEIGAKGSQTATFGKQTTATGSQSFAIGNKTIAKGDESLAQGYQSVTLGNGSHAEGQQTVAAGDISHTEGLLTITKGQATHAEGYNTEASGLYAHSEGHSTKAKGDVSHAEGFETVANGLTSHSEGYYTQAVADCQHVSGAYNIGKDDTLFEIGNGSYLGRSNAFEVYRDGHAEIGAMGTTDLSVATKGYVDNKDKGFVNLIDNQTIGGTKTFSGAVNFDNLMYTNYGEFRFGDHINFTDNTNAHNAILQIYNNDIIANRTFTAKSVVNVDGLLYAGGREIRFPDYVDFKDNTEQHNTVLKIDTNYINAEKIITAKKGLNIDVQPTEAQHAARKDYVDNGLQNVIEVAEGKNKSLVITATIYRDIPTRENFSPYDWHRVDGSMIETFDDFVEYVTRGDYPEYDLQCVNSNILNGNNIQTLSMVGYNYIVNYNWLNMQHIVIPAWYIAENFKVGDVLLITETNIPDWWISIRESGTATFNKLETTKVDLDSKVTKFDATGLGTKVYTARPDGTDGTYALETKAYAWSIPNRDGNGCIKTGTPIADDDCATKAYVDANAGSSIDIQKITYSELKTLRDSGTLVPGQQYRITDYTCTTVTTNTSSAGHQFDIIVTADTESLLNETARAVLHEGDTYFANCNLEAWQLKYCIDNDTTRFAWADTTNGKGVIYFMKDEWGNECPYDFKNILFTSSGKYTDAYTFSYTDSSVIRDASIVGHAKDCRNNIIKEYISSNAKLSFNVFYSTLDSLSCSGNTLGKGCRHTSFSQNCSYNTLGNSCYGNTFGRSCYGNTIGYECYSNTFGNYCSYNILNAKCSFNTFSKGYCKNNTLGTSCENQTFGEGCNYNTFGNYCKNNKLGNSCQYNVFNNYCHYSTFGNYCTNNTFGNGCYGNTFGNYCRANMIGSACSFIVFGSSSTNINYCQYNIIDNGCMYLYISSTDTTASSDNYLQNVHIHSGVTGSSTENSLTITVPDRALEYEYNVVKTGTTTVEI